MAVKKRHGGTTSLNSPAFPAAPNEPVEKVHLKDLLLCLDPFHWGWRLLHVKEAACLTESGSLPLAVF